MLTSIIEILSEAEVSSRKAVKAAVSLLGVAGPAVKHLCETIQFGYPAPSSPETCGLLETARKAHHEFNVERSIAYDPFEMFWDHTGPIRGKSRGFHFDSRRGFAFHGES